MLGVKKVQKSWNLKSLWHMDAILFFNRLGKKTIYEHLAAVNPEEMSCHEKYHINPKYWDTLTLVLLKKPTDLDLHCLS